MVTCLLHEPGRQSMPQTPKCFEDFAVGDVIPLGVATPDREALVAYAKEFDPAPMHLDDDLARNAFQYAGDDARGAVVPLDGLIASNWHVGAMFMRTFYDGLLVGSTSRGAPGMEVLKFPNPVRAGDTIRLTLRVMDIKSSRSRPDMGLVLFETRGLNQRDELVIYVTSWTMFGRREVAHAVV